MTRRRVVALLLVVTVAALLVAWWWPSEAPLVTVPPTRAPQQPTAIAPRVVAQPVEPATVTPDAGLAMTGIAEDAELLAFVPGAPNGERVRASRSSGGDGSYTTYSRSCTLKDERCTMKIEPGDWSLTVLQQGTTPPPTVVRLVPGRNEVTLNRVPTSSVRVRVVDSRGAPIPMATVALAPPKDSLRLPGRVDADERLATTNDSGEAMLSITLGSTLIIYANEPRHHPSDLATLKSTDAFVELSMHRLPFIRGRVVQSSGAVLTTFSVNGTDHTAPDGRFELMAPIASSNANIRASTTLTFAAEGSATLHKEVPIELADIELGDIVLGAAREVRGQVVDRVSRAGVAGASVFIDQRSQTTTGSDGRFVLADVPRDAVLFVRHAGFVSTEAPVAPDANELVVLVERGVVLSGQVTGSARVIVAVGSTVELATVNPDGTFSFSSLRPGRWLLEPSALPVFGVLEGAPLARQTRLVQMRHGDATTNTPVDLGPGGTTGVVVKSPW